MGTELYIQDALGRLQAVFFPALRQICRVSFVAD
jgi:hypothetical protein